MPSADSIIRAIRIGKKANRELHEADRALHHGQSANDDSKPLWTDHPNVKSARANSVQDIVEAGPQQRGGREIR